MDAYPEEKPLVRSVPDPEGGDRGEEIQRHKAHLPGVQPAIRGGESGHCHVGVTDRLHLNTEHKTN